MFKRTPPMVAFILKLLLVTVKSDSILPKVICLIESPLEVMKNVFLFHLKRSFRSQGILVFVTTFWSCRKNRLIRKIRLTSKFMTLQLGLQTIEIHILPNISQRKGNQKM